MEQPALQARIGQVKKLIWLRRKEACLREGEAVFHRGLAHPRWVWYDRGELQVLLNCGIKPWPLDPGGACLFTRKLDQQILSPGGICIRRK